MENETVIWIDLQTTPATVDLSAEVGLLCPLFKIHDLDKIADLIRALTPRAVFVEYDHPNEELLEPLKRLASDFPESCFVMITQEHSERLAVWALRARIWDYLVKPIDPSYLLSCVGVLVNREIGTTSGIDRKNSGAEQKTVPNRDEGANISGSSRAGNKHGTKRVENPITPALAFVNANYAEKITLDAVSKLCGLGRYQFSRTFKQTHGTTFRQFVIILRIQKAEQILSLANVSVTDAAFSVGFNDLSHFAQMFRRYVGVRPSDYVRRAKLSFETKRNAKLP